jgi:hypothetical protein
MVQRESMSLNDSTVRVASVAGSGTDGMFHASLHNQDARTIAVLLLILR